MNLKNLAYVMLFTTLVILGSASAQSDVIGPNLTPAQKKYLAACVNLCDAEVPSPQDILNSCVHEIGEEYNRECLQRGTAIEKCVKGVSDAIISGLLSCIERKTREAGETQQKCIVDCWSRVTR